jgi:hypothetical protein
MTTEYLTVPFVPVPIPIQVPQRPGDPNRPQVPQRPGDPYQPQVPQRPGNPYQPQDPFLNPGTP